MRPGEASHTAQFMTLFRALESGRPENRRLFNDPFAGRYLPPGLKMVAFLSGLRVIHWLACGYIDRRWPGARTSGVARTRFIDEAVADAMRGGAGQLVLLGAGYDSRPYRLPGASQLRIFEVDHPSTSEDKARRTRAALGGISDDVHFVRIDFDRENLERALQEAGYQRGVPTVFVWEGVSNYLSADAVDVTLSFCGMAAGGSVLVFTYVDQAVLSHPEMFYGSRRIMKLLNSVDERWTYGMDPRAVKGHLQRYGLEVEEDLSATEYRFRYYGEESGRMRGYEFYRVATARVVTATQGRRSDRGGQ